MSQRFLEPHLLSGGNVKIQIDLSNYETKAKLKGATGICTSRLASKTDLVSLKTKTDNLVLDTVKTAPADLSKPINVVDNDVIKKPVYDRLVIKVNAIDNKIPSTSGLVTKILYDSNKQDLEKKNQDVDQKIPNTSWLVKIKKRN